MRHGVLTRAACGNELVELVEEFIGAELIGIRDLEIRKHRVEMAAKFDFRGDILGQNRDSPRIGTRSAVRLADIVWQRLAFMDEGARAGQRSGFRWPVVARIFGAIRFAPAADDVFAVMPVRDSMSGEILPEQTHIRRK